MQLLSKIGMDWKICVMGYLIQCVQQSAFHRILVISGITTCISPLLVTPEQSISLTLQISKKSCLKKNLKAIRLNTIDTYQAELQFCKASSIISSLVTQQTIPVLTSKQDSYRCQCQSTVTAAYTPTQITAIHYLSPTGHLPRLHLPHAQRKREKNH